MRILITAGPTREFLDPVRFLSNASTGKMGYAIAAEAAQRGHDVVLVSGPVERAEPKGVTVVRVVSAREMFEASVSHFDQCHAAVMTAAVCDYRPAARADHKLKKDDRAYSPVLEPTEDILAHVGAAKGGRVVIGFAVEDHDARRNAEVKLARKRCDAIVLNGPGTIGSDAAEIEILRADIGWSPAVSGTKAEIGVVVVDLVETLVRLRAVDVGE